MKVSDGKTVNPVTPARDCWWILPGRLLAGPARALPELWSSAFLPERVLDLRLESAALDRTVPRLHLPLEDFSLPSADKVNRACAWLEEGLAAGERIYLHCAAGCGRSGVIAGALLIRQGLEASQVLEQLAALRRQAGLDPRCPETKEQRAWLAAGAPGLGLAEPRK